MTFFTKKPPGTAPRFPLFHVPHDGGQFPEKLLETLCISRKQFKWYHDQMRDLHVEELIPEEYRSSLHTERFPVSRLLCDVERFPGPEEPMERYGMGFCYERVYDGTKIRTVTDELKEKTMVCYRAHQERMNRRCREHSRLLLLDLHSYSDRIVPKSLRDPREFLPDLCIGTDPVFTPGYLAETTERLFRREGFTVSKNKPYAGCFVPGAVLSDKVQCDLTAVMLEFHRRCYLERSGRCSREKTKRIRELIRQVIRETADR